MCALRLAETPVVTPAPASLPQLRVSFEDALASSRRVWLRGRVHGPLGRLSTSENANAAKRRYWWRLWRAAAAPSLPTVHLRLKVGGSFLEAAVPLQTSGRFEALLPLELPLTRRGWRVARYQLTCNGFAAEACNVILTPPHDATGVVAVLLPLEYTFAKGAAQRLLQSDFTSRLTKLLRDLEPGAQGCQSIYYLACVPDSADRQAELALAGTSLGWPAGTFVLLPGKADEVETSFGKGMEHLRWLFAGDYDLSVLNAGPALAQSLAGQLKPAQDRAEVRLIQWESSARESAEASEPPAGRSTADKLPASFPWLRASASSRPTRTSLLPRSPTVFCHGMLACSMLKLQLPEDHNCFSPLRNFLRERGCQVLFPQVLPTGGVAERAAELREQIRRWTDEPVNLIAHSMGGLDARYLITHLGMAERVRSLTTISTPHRGTHLADWFLENYRRRVPVLLALEALGVNVDGFRDCRPVACRAFNANTPDRPEVRYFSYGGEVSPARLSPFLRRAWNILTAVEGPNDGMVATASAHWGEYLGSIHADHFAQTPDAAFVRPDEDFDALGFYSRLIEDLARRGF